MVPAAAPTVFVIDDDDLVRASIQGMLKSVGLRAEMFETPQKFLQSKRPDAPSCLILDVRLPGVSGLAFQRELAEAGVEFEVAEVADGADDGTGRCRRVGEGWSASPASGGIHRA